MWISLVSAFQRYSIVVPVCCCFFQFSVWFCSICSAKKRGRKKRHWKNETKRNKKKMKKKTNRTQHEILGMLMCIVISLNKIIYRNQNSTCCRRAMQFVQCWDDRQYIPPFHAHTITAKEWSNFTFVFRRAQKKKLFWFVCDNDADQPGGVGCRVDNFKCVFRLENFVCSDSILSIFRE